GQLVSTLKHHAELEPAERKAFAGTHTEVAAFLASEWKFPPALCVPIEFHHRPHEVQEPALRRMAEVVFLAGRCADIFVEKSAMWSIADVRHLCTSWFKVSEIDCDSLLVEI